MPYEIARATTFMYMQRYIEFVLDAYEELKLPYPFTVSLGYIASPVFMRDEIFLAFDDEHEVIGSLSLIHGTAEEGYSNREIIQLQLLHIKESYRCTKIFFSLLSMLVQCIDYKEEPVQELRFWTSKDEKLRRLISRRIDASIKCLDTTYGELDYYIIDFNDIRTYMQRFRQHQYF